MSEYPPVSCRCLSYGRIRVLNESLKAFLEQDYKGEKELLILNDHDQIKLHFDHPEVRIVNLDKRFKSLGEKLNAAVEESKHDISVPWSDDDYQLPWSLTVQAGLLEKYPDFFGIQTFFRWYENKKKMEWVPRYDAHGVMTFTKDTWRKAGGYGETSWGEDRDFSKRVKLVLKAKAIYLPVRQRDAYYISRRHTSVPQLGNMRHKFKDPYHSFKAIIGKEVWGEHTLEPLSKTNYIKETKKALYWQYKRPRMLSVIDMLDRKNK